MRLESPMVTLPVDGRAQTVGGERRLLHRPRDITPLRLRLGVCTEALVTTMVVDQPVALRLPLTITSSRCRPTRRRTTRRTLITNNIGRRVLLVLEALVVDLV
jgi:hypothetical protein